jgi:HPt (histidine-containing phosphotransfer) domain-containing protein
MRILDKVLNEYVYDKQPPDVIAAAAAEVEAKKEKSEAQAAATAAETEQAPSVSPDSPEPLLDMPGLNVGRGLVFFEGDRETYVGALQSFTKNVPEVLDKLRVVTEENLPDYAINVHGLKSMCGWICADGIQARAANLEALSKAGYLVGVTMLNGALLNETETFMNELRNQLEEVIS